MSAMFNRAPSLRRLTLALLCLAGLVGLFFMIRCRQAVPSAASRVLDPRQIAHLNILNVSQCDWRIVVTPSRSGDKHTWELSLAQSLDVDLAAGDYDVEQVMMGVNNGPDSTRRFPMLLVVGGNYRWRLVTLLSDSAEAKR